jgi:hypothetical protein
MGYIYVIHVREFINNGENIWKIGRTYDILKRFAQYPKGSKLICCIFVNDEVQVEQVLKDDLKKYFVHRRDIGLEYFEAEQDDFINHVLRAISNVDKTTSLTDANLTNAKQTDVKTVAKTIVKKEKENENKKDPTIAISEYIDQNMKALIGEHIRTITLYQQFLDWVTANQIITRVTHKTFLQTLKEVYHIDTFLHEFEEGRSTAIMFKKVQDYQVEKYFQKYCIKTNVKTDILRATTLYSHYSSTVKDALPKKEFLELAFKSIGPYILKRKFARKFWQGMRIRVDDAVVCEEDENEDIDGTP